MRFLVKNSGMESGRKSFAKSVGFGLLITFFFLAVLLLISERWLLATWEVLTPDEILYHLSVSMDGTNPDMIRDYIFHYGIWAVVAAGMLAAVLLLMRKYMTALFLPALLLCVPLSIGILGYSLWDLDRNLGIVSYIQRERNAGSGADYIAERYVDPAEVKLTFPEKKRNLIYIYLESMEMSYADRANGGAFSDNYIKELTKLALENDCFNGNSGKLNGAYVLPGATWTMGGLFAQSSGLPLKIALSGNRMADQENFFKDATVLGDVLEEQGYSQAFMIGSKASFGGRDKYYQQHGGFEILDYPWAIKEGKIPEDYHVFWGYEDEKLFAFAKEKLTELASKNQPFHFTMLTVDSHFEDGYVCRLCEDAYGDDQYANVIACSSRQVSSFVEWIRTQDFYKDTTIVLCGDHITMDKNFFENLEDGYQRRTYTAILNSAVTTDQPEKERKFSTMDMFPTTLAAMGVEIEGARLGLGVNLYDSSAVTLIEKEGLDAVREGLNAPSAFMNRLSEVRITEDLLKKIKKEVTVEAEEGLGGKICFSVKKLNWKLSFGAVERVVLRLNRKDPETGQTSQLEYEMQMSGDENNPNKFYVTYQSDLPCTESELSNLSGAAYLWAGDFEDYQIGELVTGE